MSEERLNAGIEAARDGDYNRARDIFNDMVDNDDTNVEAWLWLARVTRDKEEKRVCLNTVLELDPENETAQQMLAKVDTQAGMIEKRGELVPGISRQSVKMVAIGGFIYAFLLCAISFAVIQIISGTYNSRQALAATVTQQVIEGTGTAVAMATDNAFATETEIVNITATANAISPLPTATSDLPATWTPVPSPTSPSFRLYDLPPATIGGRIIGWGGRNILSNGFLIPRIYPLSSQGASTDIHSEDRVINVVANLSFDRVIYQKYFQAFDTWTLYEMDGNRPAAGGRELNDFFTVQLVDEAKQPKLTADGTKMVFSAEKTDEQTIQLFVFDFATETIQRITNDKADYTFPVISPDGTQVVAVRNDRINTPGEDLVLIQLDPATGFSQTPLTSDFSTNVESMPFWSPDGQYVAYTVNNSSTPKNRDIWVYQFFNGQPRTAVKLIESPADEAYPVFDPTSRYLAFASNEVDNRFFNIFIVDIQSPTQKYQLTESQDDEIPGGWGN
ncbi:hypothetical protein MASR2M15_12290 [Anaerolineales bacterium]